MKEINETGKRGDSYKPDAKLTYACGSMDCGKTTLMLQNIYKYTSKGLPIHLMKPLVDTKGGDTIVSRIGLSRKVDHLIPPGEDVYNYLDETFKKLKEQGIEVSCIFVDESQFLEVGQAEGLHRFVVTHDTPAFCVGLRSDFRTKGFPGGTRLLELADNIQLLETICRCGRVAQFNTRKVNDVFTFEGDQRAIDGEGDVSYEPLCPKCYYGEKENARQYVYKPRHQINPE